MNGEEQVLVRGGPNNVAHGPELPGPEGGLPEEVGAGELQRDDEDDDVFGQRLGAAELRDLQ